jgi:hypothetical protein
LRDEFVDATVALVSRVVGAKNHIVAVYDDPIQVLRDVATLVHDELATGEKTVHVLDTQQHARYLVQLEHAGVDVSAALQTGQLELWDWHEAGLRAGAIDADAVISALIEWLREPNPQGISQLYIVRNLETELRGVPTDEQVLTHETSLNRLLAHSGAVVICLYDTTTISGAALFAALRAHPYILARGRLYTNPLYVPSGQPRPGSRQRTAGRD